MAREESSGVFGVMVVAAVAGFVAGLLLAPKSGAETREELKQRKARLEGQAREGLDIAKEVTNEGRKELKAVMHEAAQDARELSSDAKIRAKRTAEHAKTGAQTVESKAKQAWGARSRL